MNTDLETKLIQKFFRKEKQERYIRFAASTKNRHKLLRELYHLRDLNWDLFNEIPVFDVRLLDGDDLKQSCYAISTNEKTDQTTIPATDLDLITDSGYAMILVFGDAEQVYYEGEPPHNRYLSKRL
jgi:hypothetical protein